MQLWEADVCHVLFAEYASKDQVPAGVLHLHQGSSHFKQQHKYLNLFWLKWFFLLLMLITVLVPLQVKTKRPMKPESSHVVRKIFLRLRFRN